MRLQGSAGQLCFESFYRMQNVVLAPPATYSTAQLTSLMCDDCGSVISKYMFSVSAGFRLRCWFAHSFRTGAAVRFRRCHSQYAACCTCQSSFHCATTLDSCATAC